MSARQIYRSLSPQIALPFLPVPPPVWQLSHAFSCHHPLLVWRGLSFSPSIRALYSSQNPCGTDRGITPPLFSFVLRSLRKSSAMASDHCTSSFSFTPSSSRLLYNYITCFQVFNGTPWHENCISQAMLV